MTEVGTVEVAAPRDRAGTFAHEVLAKRKRRTSGIDELVVSLTARGLTTGRSPRTYDPRCDGARRPS